MNKPTTVAEQPVTGTDTEAADTSRPTIVSTQYIRGVLDSTGRLGNVTGPGYVTDYWRSVIAALCDRVDELEADRV